MQKMKLKINERRNLKKISENSDQFCINYVEAFEEDEVVETTTTETYSKDYELPLKVNKLKSLSVF